MTSRLVVNSVRHTGASADAITMDASGNVTFPGNATCSGTATGFGGGITVAQQFRQNTFTATNNSETYFTSNWEKVDTDGQGAITSGGTFADPSSGVFAFPTTGYYLVQFQSYFEDSGYNTIATIQIETTIDNGSNYVTPAVSYFGTQYDQSGNNYAAGVATTIFDVTNVSTHKVRFRAFSNSTVSWDGSSTVNRTYVTFIRLGDT